MRNNEMKCEPAEARQNDNKNSNNDDDGDDGDDDEMTIVSLSSSSLFIGFSLYSSTFEPPTRVSPNRIESI